MKGFTIVEIILVVVILGILAAVAIPKVVGPNEMIISSEGRETLATLVSAQKSYYLDHSNTYTNNMANLDVAIPASQYFDVPVALNPGASGLVAMVQRTGGAYTLRISDAGVITCTPSPSVACTSIHCTKNPGGNRCN